MRADRLVATLLVLQSRGRVTAAEVAEELEVSMRTARRDLEALSMAGIPVYSQAGQGRRAGRWSAAPAPTSAGSPPPRPARCSWSPGPSSAVTPEAKAALRKLVQALPETFRAEAEAAASAVVLDPASGARRRRRRPAHLDALQRRRRRRACRCGSATATGPGAQTERVVHPLGLVEKGSIWYLIADTEAACARSGWDGSTRSR